MVYSKMWLNNWLTLNWLFTDCFSLIIWYSTGSSLSGYYFCKEEIGVYKPLFSLDFSFSFLRQYCLFSEYWINFWIFNLLAVLEFCNLKWFFATHVHIVGFLEQYSNIKSSSTILRMLQSTFKWRLEYYSNFLWSK